MPIDTPSQRSRTFKIDEAGHAPEGFEEAVKGIDDALPSLGSCGG